MVHLLFQEFCSIAPCFVNVTFPQCVTAYRNNNASRRRNRCTPLIANSHAKLVYPSGPTSAGRSIEISWRDLRRSIQHVLPCLLIHEVAVANSTFRTRAEVFVFKCLCLRLCFYNSVVLSFARSRRYFLNLGLPNCITWAVRQWLLLQASVRSGTWITDRSQRSYSMNV